MSDRAKFSDFLDAGNVDSFNELFGNCESYSQFWQKLHEVARDRSQKTKDLVRAAGSYRGICGTAGRRWNHDNLAFIVDEQWPLFMKSDRASLYDDFNRRQTIDDRIDERWGFAYLSDFVAAADMLILAGRI
jgi:hypothetical protein